MLSSREGLKQPKMFGSCVVMATNGSQGSFNSDELRDFGKSCFLQLIDHLRGKV